MDNFAPNSYKSKSKKPEAPPEKRVEKVVSGRARTKKKSEIRKFTDVFISDDAKNVGEYICRDVLVPRIIDTIEDIVTNGIRIIFRGEAGLRSGKRTNASKVSYSSYYNGGRIIRDSEPARSRNSYSYDEIIIESRGEAEEVLSRMWELLDTYEVVSVADLYDLVGVTGNYTDNKYGWKRLDGASVVRVRDGYMLKLPRVTQLD